LYERRPQLGSFGFVFPPRSALLAQKHGNWLCLARLDHLNPSDFAFVSSFDIRISDFPDPQGPGQLALFGITSGVEHVPISVEGLMATPD